MRPMLRRSIVPIALLASACAGVQNGVNVRGGRPNGPAPITDPRSVVTGHEPGRQPGVDPTRPDLSGTAARPTMPDERRVCRRSSRPSGYVAVAYVIGSNECVADKKHTADSYSVAILSRHTNRPIGTELDVCADQAIPSGWVEDRDAAGTDLCPGATSRSGATTRRIRKAR